MGLRHQAINLRGQIGSTIFYCQQYADVMRFGLRQQNLQRLSHANKADLNHYLPETSEQSFTNRQRFMRLLSDFWNASFRLLKQWIWLRQKYIARHQSGRKPDVWHSNTALTLRLFALCLANIRTAANGSPKSRKLFRDKLGLGASGLAPIIESAPVAQTATIDSSITIVMPIYNTCEVAKTALNRVATNTTCSWRLIAIDDASIDPEIGQMLADWRASLAPDQQTRVHILSNSENLGFVETVNRGLRMALQLSRHDPVVLLNSDAMVPRGWAGRLVAPMSDPSVASVTPMSNNAGILSMSGIDASVALLPGESDLLDAHAQRTGGVYEIPTGVGFCMALSPAYLAQLPQFDTVFSPGYGEEVDWCMTTRGLGGRHVCQANLFVEHIGDASFGNAAKTALIADHDMVLRRRHPDFGQVVGKFCTQDPLVFERLSLTLALFNYRATRSVAVFLGHAMGGGAEDALRRELATEVTENGCAVVIRVGTSQTWVIELHGASGVIAGATDSWPIIKDLLAGLTRRKIIYSCGVGTHDPLALPQRLLGIISNGQYEFEMRMHDYFPLCPDHTLLGEQEIFAGVPKRASLEGNQICTAGWQSRWGELVAEASKITCFSDTARELVVAAYPHAADITVVAPHDLLCTPPRADLSKGQTIGILGDISREKGAEVISRLSRSKACRALGLKFVLIGCFDPTIARPKRTKMHGPYAREDITQLAQRYKIGCWFIPSVWPETFSFTTHEALATGLPVACFDLGGQAEAVRRSGKPNTTIPLEWVRDAPDDIAQTLAALKPASERFAGDPQQTAPLASR